MNWMLAGKTCAFDHLAFDNTTSSALDYGLDLRFLKRKPIHLTRQALVMLNSLNDYDKQQVFKEIHFINDHPNASSSLKHIRNPFARLYRTQYPFRNYHYQIRYKIADGGKVVIDDVYFDKQLHGERQVGAAQRTMLYHSKQEGSRRYDSAKSKDYIDEMFNEWKLDLAKPTNKISTSHATVNGMLNDFKKAVELMGVHTQVAYPDDNVKEYTLFHNPTDGVKLDLVECVFDKLKGKKSHNAQHLAAVIKQCQDQGQATKWTVHSQGAIIFCAALEHLRVTNPSMRLTQQQVAIHGSGANLTRLRLKADAFGMKINNVRNNPFDLVPNLAGQNDLSKSSFKRSMQFLGRVTGRNGDDPGASPHTLPYLGIETYKTQLQMLGWHDKAAIIQKYIDQNTSKT